MSHDDVTIGKVTVSWGPVSPPILRKITATMRGFVGDVVFFFDGDVVVGLDLYRDWVKHHGTLKPGEWYAEVKSGH